MLSLFSRADESDKGETEAREQDADKESVKDGRMFQTPSSEHDGAHGNDGKGDRKAEAEESVPGSYRLDGPNST